MPAVSHSASWSSAVRDAAESRKFPAAMFSARWARSRAGRAECRAVDAAPEGAKLDDTFTFREKTTSVRWMWQHLVEEYARHNGHADLFREPIDGSAGL
jgi:Protein of unknown function (DUF664)